MLRLVHFYPSSIYYVFTVNKCILQLFTEAPLQLDSDTYYYTVHQPTQQFDSNSTVFFHIAGTQEEFIDPQIVMHVEFKITKSDGTDIDKDALVAVRANMAHTMWSDVTVKLNGKVITGQAHKRYPYICWLDHVFKASKNRVADMNAMQALYSDIKFGAEAPTSPEFDDRRKLCELSKKVRLEFVLNCELTRQDRLILPMVDLDIVCTPSADAIRVESYTDATTEKNEIVKLLSVKLICKKVKVNAALYNDLIINLQNKPALYPIKRYSCVTVNQGSGLSQFSANLLGSPTRLPEAVYLMIVQTAREVGDRSICPFKIETDNLDLLHLTSQGVDYPNIVYKPTTNQFLPYVKSQSQSPDLANCIFHLGNFWRPNDCWVF